MTEVLIDRTLGTHFGDLTASGGIAAAFNGTTNEAGTSTARSSGSVAAWFIGTSLDASRKITKATCHGSNNNGYVSGGNPSTTLELRAQVGGSAPANAAAAATAGVSLGSVTFTDTANESTGRDIASSNTTTLYDHVWIYGTNASSNTINFAELALYEDVVAALTPSLFTNTQTFYAPTVLLSILFQTHFRARSDSAAVNDTPVWIAAEDTNFSQTIDTPFRMRVTVQEVNGETSTAGTGKLQSQKNAGAWQDVTTSSTNIKSVDASSSVDGATLSTKRLSGTGGYGTAGYDENGALASFGGVSPNTNIEIEFGVQIVGSDVTIGDVIKLKVIHDSGTPITPVLVPSITAQLAVQNLVPSLYADAEQFYAPVVTYFKALLPSLYADADAFLSAAVARGSVNLTPSPYADADTFYAETVAATYALLPAIFNDGDEFYSASVAYTQELLPALYDDADAFPSAVVTSIYALTAPLLIDADTFYDPSVSATYALLPTLFSDGDEFFTATITTGVVFVLSSLYVDDDSFPSATVLSIYALVPGFYVDDDAFYSGTVTTGEVFVLPSLYVDADAFLNATVNATYELTPALYADADIFYASTVEIFSNIRPPLYVDDDIFYSGVVTRGGVFVLPALYADGDAFFSPVVVNIKRVLPELYVDPDTFYSIVVTGGYYRFDFTALVDGYSEVIESNISLFTPEFGPPKRRRSRSKSSSVLSFRVIMDADELASFLSTYRTTLKDGTVAFSLNHPRRQETAVFKFTTIPNISHVEADIWHLGLSMREKN